MYFLIIQTLDFYARMISEQVLSKTVVVVKVRFSLYAKVKK